MQDKPSAAQMLDAVRDFISTLPTTGAHNAQQQFHRRVASNVLAIVQRELEHAPHLDSAERERLRALLGDTEDDSLLALNKLLCARIAAGEITLDTPGLRDHLIATTRGKLSIDQPHYAGYRRWPDAD